MSDLKCEIVTPDLVFSNNLFLNSSCSEEYNTNYSSSSFFTGYSKINTTCTTGLCSTLCEYSSDSSTSGTRIGFIGSNGRDLSIDKYYRFTYQTSRFSSFNLTLCKTVESTDILVDKLNSVSYDDLYNEITPITPFLVFLIIFSFSYFVLRKVINSSSSGKSDI